MGLLLIHEDGATVQTIRQDDADAVSKIEECLRAGGRVMYDEAKRFTVAFKMQFSPHDDHIEIMPMWGFGTDTPIDCQTKDAWDVQRRRILGAARAYSLLAYACSRGWQNAEAKRLLGNVEWPMGRHFTSIIREGDISDG